MKSKILLLALTVALLTSCTTSYKSGQTPDDVYYSPTRPHDETVKTEKKEDKRNTRNDEEYYDDQYLRMKVRNRTMWNELDDPFYYSSRRYNTVSYNCCCMSNPWSPNVYWNNTYNPYYHNTVILSPKSSVVYNAPRTFNLSTYNNNALMNSNYSNPKISNNSSYNNQNSSGTYNSPRNNNTRNNDNSGNILRDIFKGSSNNNNSSNSSNNNSSTNSSSSSSSSSGSSSTSTPAPVRKF